MFRFLQKKKRKKTWMTAGVISTFTPFCCVYMGPSHRGCWVPAHSPQPASLCCSCINLKQTLQPKTLRRPLFCSPARPSPPQPAAPNTPRATGLFKQKLPLRATCLQEEEDLEGKAERCSSTQRTQGRFIYFKALLFTVPA